MAQQIVPPTTSAHISAYMLALNDSPAVEGKPVEEAAASDAVVKCTVHQQRLYFPHELSPRSMNIR